MTQPAYLSLSSWAHDSLSSWYGVCRPSSMNGPASPPTSVCVTVDDPACLPLLVQLGPRLTQLMVRSLSTQLYEWACQPAYKCLCCVTVDDPASLPLLVQLGPRLTQLMVRSLWSQLYEWACQPAYKCLCDGGCPSQPTSPCPVGPTTHSAHGTESVDPAL